MNNISQLIKELDKAIQCGDIERADEISNELFHLQNGMEADAAMPDQFLEKIKDRSEQELGGQKTMNVKKVISIVVIAAVIAGLSITSLATRWFGIRDLVINNNDNSVAVTGNIGDSGVGVGTDTDSDVAVSNENVKQDLIAMQGYPDSNEYKASVEWNLFCSGYDTDQSILNKLGNGSNEVTEKYPLYTVYTQEMADKLEEIVKKYKLTLHKSITIAENHKDLIKLAGTGDFIGNLNKVYSGYVYDDGTFQFDGEAILKGNKAVYYQFGNYVKGTFSTTYLNVGDVSLYKEWAYKTSSGVEVTLALGKHKALVITDLENSYVIINVLSGTEKDSTFAIGSITDEDLQDFADSFDYSQIK